MADRIIQVSGDPTVDWLAIRNEEPNTPIGVYFWLGGDKIDKLRLSSQAGGSVLLGELIRKLAADKPVKVEGLQLDNNLLKQPINNLISTSWTVWKSFKDGKGKKSAFRLSEWGESETYQYKFENQRQTNTHDICVIEDSALGFRNCPECWPNVLASGAGEYLGQIILKLTQYGDGRKPSLITCLLEKGLGNRTTIVTSINDLRSCSVKICESLSWERLMEQVVEAVYSDCCPFVSDHDKRLMFKQVVVTVGTSGAVVLSEEGNALIFDRSGQEGDFIRKHPGQMMGYNTCVTASLAVGLAESSAGDNALEDVVNGVGLARLLHLTGYEVVGDQEGHHLQFPYDLLTNVYRERVNKVKTSVPELDEIWDIGLFEDKNCKSSQRSSRGKWSILEETVVQRKENYGGTGLSGSVDSVRQCAREIVLRGPRAVLTKAPIETVGAWRSGDRVEIEGVRSVNNAMREYLQLRNPDKPLSLAVFGPPGAGKSFAIKEIAKGLGIGKDAQLTFNLSQFESPEELGIAFHQIRDLHLKAKMPVVFWDEFDTPCEGKLLGWLRYFLAPMQDGEFTDRGRVHPLGSGIYVFAGATRSSFQEFCKGASTEELAAKKPDFISRLRAYINIQGPNGNPNTIEDKQYVIRRAFLLNHFLEFNAPFIKKNKEFNVDPGVLDAFLLVSRYAYGARSIENMVKMSTLTGKRKFELSSLPPDNILDMHVNANEFNNLTSIGYKGLLRVGITGHIGLDPAKMAELKAGIEKVIEFIQSQYPQRNLTVFSPLAVGADRLVARALLKREGARLIAVLPCEDNDYINDFGPSDEHHINYQGAELRQEFRYWLAERSIETIVMPASSSRDEAYQKAGNFVAEHSDVTIAIWDGLESQGVGGTGDVVAIAMELGKPLCHIWAGNYKEKEDKRTSVGDLHGQVRYMNFPAMTNGEWVEE